MERFAFNENFCDIARRTYTPGGPIYESKMYAQWGAWERLKAYEAALPLERAQELGKADQEGRLVVLPTPLPKVGDTVYELFNYTILKSIVTEVDSSRLACTAKHRTYGSVAFTVWDIGQTIFMTYQEAKTAQKSRKEK